MKETAWQLIEQLPDDATWEQVLDSLARQMWTELGEEATTHLDDNESALLSEAALRDWNRAEEDRAWSHLQPGRQLASST